MATSGKQCLLLRLLVELRLVIYEFYFQDINVLSAKFAVGGLDLMTRLCGWRQSGQELREPPLLFLCGQMRAEAPPIYLSKLLACAAQLRDNAYISPWSPEIELQITSMLRSAKLRAAKKKIDAIRGELEAIESFRDV